ncbi:MAG: hypothetical protein ABL878_20215 [Burkholderiales bacterium]
MNTSTSLGSNKDEIKRLIDSLREQARRHFASDAQWARASGVPKETLSRLRSKLSCDIGTLWALTAGAGCSLEAVPAAQRGQLSRQDSFDREYESALLDLCASGIVDPTHWRARGNEFFMGGLATLLAGATGFDRARYLRLAEALHAGVTTPEVFALWLKRSPLRPARFLPMLRARLVHAPA